MKDYQDEIDQINYEITSLFAERITNIVRGIQENIIKPLCDKYHMRFTYADSGSMNWYFGGLDEESDIDISLYEGSGKDSWSFMTNKDSEKFIELMTLFEEKLGSRFICNLVKDYSPGF